MSKQNWKPGDVAILHGTRVVRHSRREGYWTFPDGSFGRDFDDDARPLAVIDPEDRSAVVGLAQAIGSVWASPGQDISKIIAATQDWLRKFATPKPPKPAEPTGLGAVVENDNGKRYVRQVDGWWRGDEPCSLNWTAVHAVRVLSEGIA